MKLVLYAYMYIHKCNDYISSVDEPSNLVHTFTVQDVFRVPRSWMQVVWIRIVPLYICISAASSAGSLPFCEIFLYDL